MKTCKHSPLPWKAGNWTDNYAIWGANNVAVLRSNKIENRKFIVNAVNNHERMREFLIKLVSPIQTSCEIDVDNRIEEAQAILKEIQGDK